VIRLGTKAETLEALRGLLKLSRVCPSVVFTIADWRDDETDVLRRVRDTFRDASVIVRSSAFGEDAELASLAGAHDSVAYVPANDSERLCQAVGRVISSYGRGRRVSDRGARERDQVLVQPMVTDVSMSGVVFTQDLNSGGPYYVINYDDISGKTDTVTSGNGDTSRTLIVHRDHVASISSARFRRLLQAIAEIEQLAPVPGLDIEFSLTNAGELYVFQVRRLAVQANWNRDIARSCNGILGEIRTFVEASFRPQPGLLGRRTIFAEMSDWNPAEMIGPAPRRLALTLYRMLITDGAWSRARAAMGYRDVADQPLMVSLGGRVYIDVRKSFNSFLPARLPDAIGEKLVDVWLDRLEANPELHDKVEFEVATTAYPLDYTERTRPDLLRAGLTGAEADALAASLRELTTNIVGAPGRVPERALERVRKLREHYELRTHRRPDARQAPAQIGFLLQDCRELGTVPFAVLARCAFIAEDMLRALVRLRAIHEADAARFRASVRTVLSEFLDAIHDYHAGRRSKEAFFAEFGHLRPGTYDITSLRYDQRERSLRSSRVAGTPAARPHQPFTLTDGARERIDAVLQRNGLGFDSERMFAFMRLAIVGREYAKLQFTRNLSDALELVAQWGTVTGLSREELSHLAIGDILDSLAETPVVGFEEHYHSIARRNRERHALTNAIRLPYLIGHLSDVFVIPLLKSRPNFVTDRKVTGRVVRLGGGALLEPELDGAIAVIEGADPGYDWIFSRDILGLVTKFGGANSHMAIRCAELGIPAAIGCGEQVFARVTECDEVTIDCGSGQVVPTGEDRQQW
jgi:glutamine kinase